MQTDPQAAFEAWPKSQGINEHAAAWGKRAFVAGYEAGHAAASSALAARVGELETERKKLRSALAEIRSIVNFEFGEMQREREIMDPLFHSGSIAAQALTGEKP